MYICSTICSSLVVKHSTHRSFAYYSLYFCVLHIVLHIVVIIFSEHICSFMLLYSFTGEALTTALIKE